MSLLSRLFGLGGEDKPKESAGAAPVTHKDCTIVARPQNEGGQWRVAGTISKVVDGELVERSFIRADLCMSEDEAIEVTQRKARQIIDQNPHLFDNPEDRGPV